MLTQPARTTDARGPSKRDTRKQRQKARERFGKPVRQTEPLYVRALRTLSRHVGELIEAMTPDGHLSNVTEIAAALIKYSDTIGPWARAVTLGMYKGLTARNERAWVQAANELGVGIRHVIEQTDVGPALQKELDTQVQRIRSIPIDAARKLQKTAVEAMIKGMRPATLEKHIKETCEVTDAKARLLARDAVSRANSVLTETRAKQIGSDAYIWRTSRDANVRDSHQEMEGKVVHWNKPPTLDGLTGHAGQLPNCRCTSEPIIPDHLFGDD